MLKYTVGQPPLRNMPGKINGEKDYIPQGRVVDVLESVEVIFRDVSTLWDKVSYRGKSGWVYSGYLEEYKETYAEEVDIDIATEDKYDAAQYIVWEGRKKYNMCGELCCAFIIGTKISSLLETWKQKSPNFYARIYKGILDRGTGLGDLVDILRMYRSGEEFPRLESLLVDYIIGRAMFTQYRLSDICSSYKVIVGVRINSSTGKLQTTGVSHWVVLLSVVPDGMDKGFVRIYNPFSNRVEIYSWNEFVKSVGSPTGICVKI